MTRSTTTSTATPYWVGSVDEKCNLCSKPIVDVFVDGRTKWGPWANMCGECHVRDGVGLGIGKGQLFKKVAGGRWEKMECK